jgi:hypothetical protein
MNAKRNMAKEPQPREVETRQMEGFGLKNVIEPLQEKSLPALAPRAILIPSVRALQRTPE